MSVEWGFFKGNWDSFLLFMFIYTASVTAALEPRASDLSPNAKWFKVVLILKSHVPVVAL